MQRPARSGPPPALPLAGEERVSAGAVTNAARLRVTTPAPRSIWRELLSSDGDCLVSQSPEWVDALCADGRYEDASRCYETRQGTRLVLPLVRRTGPWPSRFAPQASMPHAWGMGGLVAGAPPEPRDLTALVSDLISQPALITSIRPNPLHDHHWHSARGPGITAIPRLAHVLDLSGGAEQVWRERFDKNARSRVRKAERSGIEVECDTSGRLVPVFHELLQLSIERWARQQHEPLPLAHWRGRRRDPLEKFRHMATALGSAMRVWVAWKDGSPVASMVVLQGINASSTRSAMNKDLAAPTGANYLLEWLAIQDACAAGCRYYHLGESGASQSLAHFKEKFGGRPVPYSEYRIERLPLTRGDGLARGLVKRLLGFRDV
jgi:GNAT acetyltransferase-like protein